MSTDPNQIPPPAPGYPSVPAPLAPDPFMKRLLMFAAAVVTAFLTYFVYNQPAQPQPILIPVPQLQPPQPAKPRTPWGEEDAGRVPALWPAQQFRDQGPIPAPPAGRTGAAPNFRDQGPIGPWTGLGPAPAWPDLAPLQRPLDRAAGAVERGVAAFEQMSHKATGALTIGLVVGTAIATACVMCFAFVLAHQRGKADRPVEAPAAAAPYRAAVSSF